MKQLFLKAFVLFAIFMPQSTDMISATNHTTQHPIRGIYVTAHNTKGPRFDQLLNLVNQSDLNAMVIDIKDDEGRLTYIPSKSSPYYSIGNRFITNPNKLLEILKRKNIYPIARIVTFKDSLLAAKNPNLSFRTSQGIWKNTKGDAFVNPLLKEVWDYNIGIAIEAS